MTAPLACPECRTGTLEIHADGRVGIPVVHTNHRRDASVPIEWKARPFAACNRCEFCIEIDTRQR